MPSLSEGESMSKNHRKLGNYLINPRYQLKYIFWLGVTGMTLVVLYSLLFYFFMRENYDVLVELSPMDDAVKQQLYHELNHIILLLGGVSFLFLIIVAFLGVILSHRTAGPLYHFKKVFGRIKDGDLAARVRLRPNDDFQDVAASFNSMVDALVERAKSAK
jgi:methyl-accepting chemotaxis protein